MLLPTPHISLCDVCFDVISHLLSRAATRASGSVLTLGFNFFNQFYIKLFADILLLRQDSISLIAEGLFFEGSSGMEV
jgi:hypothetical protein